MPTIEIKGIIYSIETEVEEYIIRLREALQMFKKRLLTHGEWDEDCFYYAGKSASELEEPLNLAEQALKGVKDDDTSKRD